MRGLKTGEKRCVTNTVFVGPITSVSQNTHLTFFFANSNVRRVRVFYVIV